MTHIRCFSLNIFNMRVRERDEKKTISHSKDFDANDSFVIRLSKLFESKRYNEIDICSSFFDLEKKKTTPKVPMNIQNSSN